MERITLTPWFYYDVFDNGKRIIHIPSTELKRVQRLILRKYFKQHWTPLSVKDAASIHCGKKWLMKLDIKDFFNSITEEQIKEIIKRCVITSPHLHDSQSSSATAPLLLNNQAGEWDITSDAEQIFSICTIKGKLPTGAPTSPYIANLLLKDFDCEIEEVCRKFNVSYSRYMDDLFFSTNGKQYMLSLTELEVLRLFKELGFSINVDKIKYISDNKLQKVLGLGVNNQKPVLTKDDKRKYRSYFYNILSPLQFNKLKIYKEHELEVLGHLAYIKSIDEEYYIRIKFYIFNLLVKFNLLKKPYLKNLIKNINYNKGN